MSSKADFYLFYNELLNVNASTKNYFISNDLRSEMHAIVNYFVNLEKKLREADDNTIFMVGVLICDDFVNMANKIDNCISDFFNKSITSLSLKNFKIKRDISIQPSISILIESALVKHDLVIKKMLNP